MLEEVYEVIENALTNRNSFFFSEENLQLFLARELEASVNNFKVFLEYPVKVGENDGELNNYPWGGNRISIDLVVEKGGKYVPVEIKFKTKKQTTEFNLFGTNTEIELADQSHF